MKNIDHLLENNRRWSEQIRAQNPSFFSDLAGQQSPKYLWIGCSDSRVSANTIVGLAPGEIFVHRNVANLVIHTDMNCLSVMQFAVELLNVEHIIVCGHYGCGGVQAAMETKRHGLIDNWLRHIQDTANLYSHLLNDISDESVKLNKICELNVFEQVLNVCETTVVRDAWNRGQVLTIHGWIYDLKDGLVRDRGISVGHEEELQDLRHRFLFNDKRGAAADAS
ncbi:MAG: carbonate dehydratase [Pyrinomonadaceae bacterium]|nr:carbonate dehydratase [Pyrinomonadaceae bacterium]MBP6212214.1 carbonate dehydratase [Pyrinomonadaceae bacterium]